MTRFTLVLLVLALFLSGASVLAIVLFSFLLFRYVGFEVVVIGLLLDGYYDAFSGVPMYTISAFAAWSAAVFLRQWLIVYNTEYAPLS